MMVSKWKFIILLLSLTSLLTQSLAKDFYVDMADGRRIYRNVDANGVAWAYEMKTVKDPDTGNTKSVIIYTGLWEEVMQKRSSSNFHKTINIWTALAATMGFII
ncbi:uncharacterized protein LOC115632218 isoform X1 [Scaptodrosophila lebanonensis]|uniref:Uncharacterized protein LOC115632218 isoform X1 n=1 Tax=Drosophila lebanonensis TaxID=7225 RepID=A0A6J2UDE2_DROLE|nr:uncharacterized protein LOC115632218 isoform X1 [Scaptodrosophila lebanonensis]